MPNAELEKKGNALPVAYTPPALEIDGGDIALPRLYVGQSLSPHVQEELMKVGQIYVANGKEDPSPELLYDGPNSKSDGVLVHVLGMVKGKSWKDEDDELMTSSFDDPSAPVDADVTYNYVIALPEVNEDFPVKWLLTRSASGAAKQINTVLMKNGAKGPPHINAFRIKSTKRESGIHKWFVPKVSVVEANSKHIEICERLAVMISGASTEVAATGEEPAI